MRPLHTLSAFAAVTALAAPAAANGILPAPAPVAPFVVADSDWAGGYVGGTLAYSVTGALYCDNSVGPASPYLCDAPDDGLPNPQPSGAMFGATGGYNWQSGNIVYGAAADLMIGDLSDIAGGTDDPNYGCNDGCGLDVSAMAMLRGRVGYDAGNLLPYLTAGVALTRANAFVPGDGNEEGTYTNLVIGAGVDMMLSDSLVAGFDVLHLLERDGGETLFPGTFCGNDSGDTCGPTNFSATLARITLAYRF